MLSYEEDWENATMSCHWEKQTMVDIFQHIYKVCTPTNAHFIKLDQVLKIYIKNHFDLLLLVSVYDHHQGAFTRA